MLSVLNFFRLGSTAHLRVPCPLLGTEARAMIQICLLFWEVHIWRGIKQGRFIVLCPVWWQFQEHVSRRPQKTLMPHSRSSGHTWRMLTSEGFGPWDGSAWLGMTPSASPLSFPLLSLGQQITPHSLSHHSWSHPFNHSPNFYWSLNVFEMAHWGMLGTVLVKILYSIFGLPVMG